MAPPIKVGIIGYGFSAKCFHLPFILPNHELEVHAFLQRAAAPSEDPASKTKPWGHCTVDFPHVKHYQTADDFFADVAIELVIICTHNHREFVEKALKSGKHVVVEKPFLATSADADEMIELAKAEGKVLTNRILGFHSYVTDERASGSLYEDRRFDSDFRTLEDLVKKGALGDVREAEIHYDIPSPSWIAGWTQKEYIPGEGMIFGLGTHTIDQALHLFGPPASVTGFLRSNRGVDSDIDDTYTIILQYSGDKKNLVVTIKTAIVSHMKDQLRFFVRGTEGTYLKFGTCPQEERAIAAPAQPAMDPNFGVEDEHIWGTLTTTTEFDSSYQVHDETTGCWVGKCPSLPGWYRGYYENVAAAIRGREEICVKPEMARDGIRVIELARESHVKGATIPWS
ncbi:hypothetical protein N7474_000775 [Penicillium riverlandense]|uniref:uncharacterized protein n=1 Tax=Penicillium riverlandense TaxID=1903569 RepID=UPI0025485C95|nr:uncharacterized protein N7474_000775 [Penicillium riverlandense]KAJ5832464.1 hypothetical protein N7474_000775 [Penicillium riverlandense]